jgi:hypothetical protein
MDYSLRLGEPTPPFLTPKARLLYHMIDSMSYPFMLIAGDHWLKYDGSVWTVDADEPATEEAVAALLVEAGGVTTWWGT